MQRWLQTTITGAIGNDEQFAHVLKWRHATIENPDMDIPAVKAFGDLVRDKWATFMHTPMGGGSADWSYTMAGQARYTEVRTAYISQAGPAAKPSWDVPSQVSPFNPVIGSGSPTSKALPYEVCCALSLNTNFRGPRFRGRIYMFPMNTDQMGTDGNFIPSQVQLMATHWAQHFLGEVVDNSDQELHVVSLKYGTSARVQGVRVGIVPDSQRRRRRGRPENYLQVWGLPIGAA